MCQIKEGKPSVPKSMSVFLMKSWCIRSSKMITYFLTVPKGLTKRKELEWILPF